MTQLLYSTATATGSLKVAIPIVQNRNPSSTDVNCPIGIRWINELINYVFVLTDIITSSDSVRNALWEVEYGTVEPLVEIIPDTGTSPVVTTNNQITFRGDGTKIITDGLTGEIFIELGTPLSVNHLALSGVSGMLSITDMAQATGSAGKATTVSNTVTVTSSALTSNSLVFLSPPGASAVNNGNGTFTILQVGGVYPSIDTTYMYWIIN
jgi:hypothetical protein